MSRETGGPAFPVPNLEHDADFNGMTLRDYFAAGVANGLATATAPDGTWFHGDASDVAARAFEIADALLLERAK